MQKLVMAIAVIIGMFYALTVQAIGPERDTPTAILTLQQITTPANPSSGFNRIYSKGDDKLYTLNSAGEEVELGAGGAGSGRLNLLEDPSFEDGVAEGSCILCTAAEELTVVLGTLNNAKSLKLTQASGLGAYTVNKTTGSEYLATQVAASCWIKTAATGIQFKALSNAAPVATKEVSSDGNWNEYIIPFVAGTTSIGYQVTGGSASDVIYVDECFLGAKDVLNKVGYDTGWEDCGLTTSDFTGFGTVSVIEDFCRRDGSDLLMNIKWTNGTSTGVEARVNLKINGTSLESQSVATIPSIKLAGSATYSAAASGNSFVLIEPSSAYITFGYETAGAGGLTKALGSGFGGNGATISTVARIPIQGWQATFDSISEVGSGSNVRLDTANGYGSTATKIRRFSNTRTNIGSGLNCVDSATNGFSCTVLRGGFYFVSYSDVFGSAGNIGISLNASSLTTDIQALTSSEILGVATSGTGDFYVSTSSVTWLWSGDVVRPHTNGVATGAGGKSTFSMVGLLDQINAILKDVVMSPNSSNGKPVFCSADISSTGVISNQDGDCFASCTNAATPVCTFETDYWSVKPKCWHTVQGNIQGGAVSTITEFSGIQLNGSFVPVSGDRTYFCHGAKK